MEKNVQKLSPKDLLEIETEIDNSIEMIRKYAAQYSKKTHYYQLGASCVATAVGTVHTILNSPEYLNGNYIMPDQINVEKLVGWIMENKAVECNQEVLTYFISHYIMRKINKLYRSINNVTVTQLETSLKIWGDSQALERYKKEINLRKMKGVKMIRLK